MVSVSAWVVIVGVLLMRMGGGGTCTDNCYIWERSCLVQGQWTGFAIDKMAVLPAATKHGSSALAPFIGDISLLTKKVQNRTQDELGNDSTLSVTE